jgi:hypothetical protein
VESATVTDSDGSVIELAKLRDDGSYTDSAAEVGDDEGETAEQPAREEAQEPTA